MSNKEYKPTLAQLRTFVTIAEHKHFGTAASKLHISQPSLSQALVALESGLNIQLIERSTRKVIVTPAGKELLPFAKATLEAADAFVSHAKGTHGVLHGPLTIGVIPTVAPYLLPGLLPLLNQEFAELRPRIVEEQTEHLLAQLRDGRMDLAILALPTDATGLTEVPLYDEEFVVVTGTDSAHAGSRKLSLDALSNLELLLLDDGHCLRDQVIDLCKRADARNASAAHSDTRAASLTTIIQLVMAGFGATLVPLSAVATECDRPDLGLATFAKGVEAHRTIGLAYRASSTRGEEFAALGRLIVQAYGAAAERSTTVLAKS
ncbi:hydrogen peroxide-inducible genes activator [Corynebacterium sp. HMSC071B10]|uniref:hydrogen peroxide-inducible genes activator n=1 Tax=Corynebacterium sp. HMSC071B10 TaxID=1739494 RepID=UPI0008A2F9DD|nr:hydrogen peroxide-inducible genes activator [Corynebacterium sp. HMSC071B10]OFP35854.1 LysR family transcriptional regulator [Corynebacterium sp. HMSC071B10]